MHQTAIIPPLEVFGNMEICTASINREHSIGHITVVVLWRQRNNALLSSNEVTLLLPWGTIWSLNALQTSSVLWLVTCAHRVLRHWFRPLTNQNAIYVLCAHYINCILISLLHNRIRMLKQGSKLFHQRQAALACQKRLFACPGTCSKGGCGPSKTTKAFSSLNHNEVSRHSSEIEAVLHLQPRVLTAATIKPTVETRKVRISIHECVVRSYTMVTSYEGYNFSTLLSLTSLTFTVAFCNTIAPISLSKMLIL